MATHGVAQQVHLVQVQLIDQTFQNTGIKIGARACADDRITFTPARAVHEDDPEASLYQWLDVAIEVGPAASTRARTVQHDNRFFAFTAVVVMNIQIQLAVLDANEFAGVFFSNCSHD
ncbi:hypothetical protein D3C81_1196440 [compost metagenome]